MNRNRCQYVDDRIHLFGTIEPKSLSMNKTQEFEKTVENVKEGIKNTAGQFRTATEKQGETLRTASEDALSQAQDWQHRGIQLIRENPVQAVAVAFVVGVIVGLLIRN
jgi:ElaB/YqjD/DUF883 family membrane-anchored ribosome-binding protein